MRFGTDHLRATAFAGCNGALAMLVLGIAAMVSDSPLVVPPIGASVFLVATAPGSPAASGRNVVGGHAIGLLSGFVALLLFGLDDSPTALVEGMTDARIGATATALALTCAGMVFLGLGHPPAGATTLVVSLGLVREPRDLLVVLAAVCVIAVQGQAVARLQASPLEAAAALVPLPVGRLDGEPPVG